MNLKIISAGAGSGKTYRLTQEMLNLLAPDKDGKAPIRATGIIATTFTNRAAEELRERVRIGLLQHNYYKQADELEQAMIGTVHSIGVQLLERFAFEAGVSPNVDIIADDDQQLIFNQSLSTVLDIDRISEMDTLSDRLGFYKSEFTHQDWRKILKSITDLARANNFTTALLEESKAYSLKTFFAFLPPLSQETGKAMDKKLGELIKDTIQALENNEDATKTKSTTLKKLNSAQTTLKNQQYLSWYEWARLQKLKTSKKSSADIAHLKKYASFHNTHPDFQAHIRTFIQKIFDIAIAALEEYKIYKKRRGLIDYIDMEVAVLELLENKQVLEVLEAEVDLLLVDEFQDTNPLQLKIFLKLSRIVKQAIWVGDPKQSIYGFRGAAPELMQAVLEQATEHDVLRYSWRSRQDLVHTANGIFTRAFSDMPADRIALKTASQFAKQHEATQLSTAVRHWHFKFEGSRPPGSPWTEKCIASAIKELLEAKIYVRKKGSNEVRLATEGDVAVLCRSNKACQVLADALFEEGLQASTARSGLLQTSEISLVMACLKFVLNTADALSVAEILRLAVQKKLDEIVESRLEHIEKRNAHCLDKRPEGKIWGIEEKQLKKLYELSDKTKELSASELLEVVLSDLEIERILATWPNPRQRFDNLDALRNFSAHYEETCERLNLASSLGGFLLWLGKLASRKKDQQGLGMGSKAVNVLTYHKSKGLEWPIVICCNLDSRLREDIFGVRIVQTVSQIDLNQPLAGRLLCYWVNPYADQLKGTDLAEQVNDHPHKVQSQKAALAEEARLLYVGITRARDYLVLPTVLKKPSKWLNRVFHNGDESVPTLDAREPTCRWIWGVEEIAVKTKSQIYPETFAYADKELKPLVYIDEPSGVVAHPPAHFLSVRELFIDLEVKLLKQFPFEKPLVFPDDEDFEIDYPTTAHVFSTFFKGDLPTYEKKNRLLNAEELIRQYRFEDWLAPETLLLYADSFYKKLGTWVNLDLMVKSHPFLFLKDQRFFRGTLDYLLESEKTNHFYLVHVASTQHGNYFRRKSKLLDDACFLRAVKEALVQKYPTTQNFRYLVFYPLEGEIWELTLKQT